MILNSIGTIVANEWKRTEEKRNRTILGEWIVMPNHFHAIIYLKPKHDKKTSDNNYKNEFGPQRNNISSIIRGFKSSCTSQIWETGLKSFGWQKGFYDHIIRSQKSLIRIENYIHENPQKWINDKHHA